MTKPSDTLDTVTLTDELADTGTASITRISKPASHFVIRQYVSGEYEMTSNRQIKGFTMDITPTKFANTEHYVSTMHIVVEMYPDTNKESTSKAMNATQEKSKGPRRWLQFWRTKNSS